MRRAGFPIAALGACCALLALHGCATTGQRPDADQLAAQERREDQLRTQERWHLIARVSVSDGRDHGSGSLDWRQDGETFVLEMRAPVTGKSWRLSGQKGAVLLEGAGREAQRGRDAEALLQQTLGWRVPVAQLTSWVRAMRGERGRAAVVFDSEGLPKRIEQSRWTVDYRAWFTDRSPSLPRKIFARQAPYEVRLAIERWSVDD